MHVAVVCPYSLTKPGGVQGQVLAQARALRAKGHRATVLGPCDGAPPEPDVMPVGRSIPLSANGSVAPLAPGPVSGLRTIRALRDQTFDVVHLHEPLCPGPTLAALAFGPGPLIGTFHRAGPSAVYQACRPATAALARRLTLRCAVSPDARATAARALGGEYELLFNGVEAERFSSASPWPTAGPTVFFIGRHEARKGLAILLEAMTRLPQATRLWVAGEGRQTATLQRRFAGDRRIEWLGRIGDDEAASRLRGADVFCAPSLHGESFGVVLLESLAAGTPVVASDLPGYRTVASPGRQALLVPPGDAEALAAALRRVLTDPELAKELVRAGEERAAELSMDRLVDRYLDLYQRLRP